jgi:hypothetical protein
LSAALANAMTTAGICRLITPIRNAFRADPLPADFVSQAISVRGTFPWLGSVRLRGVRHPEGGQGHGRQAEAEFLERRTSCGRLRNALCQFI